MPRSCVFCQRTAPQTKEHIFAHWMSRLLPGNTDVYTLARRDKAGRLINEWTARTLDLKIKRVCSDCNSGWMQEIDQVARNALTAMILGKGITLSAIDCKRLATWATKVQMLLQYAAVRPRAASPVRLDRMYRLRDPGDVCFVWVAAYAGTWGVWTRSLELELKRPSEPEAPALPGELLTMSIGHVVFQVLIGPDSFAETFQPHVADALASWLARIWPNPSTLQWPPSNTLDDAALESYANAFVEA
jgi:hypothetical protein